MKQLRLKQQLHPSVCSCNGIGVVNRRKAVRKQMLAFFCCPHENLGPVLEILLPNFEHMYIHSLVSHTYFRIIP